MFRENLMDRLTLLEMIEKAFPSGVGVEIGVAGGHFSKQILATWKSCSMLYCVDLWAHQDAGYNDGCNISDEEQMSRYTQINKDFQGIKNVTLIKEWSHIACQRFDSGFFDFIYVDANHSYRASLNDIQAWYPKLKNGGVMAGHDYMDGPEESYGVKKAVTEFASNQGIHVFNTLSETANPKSIYGGWEGISWYFTK
jgi:hypothetical protein